MTFPHEMLRKLGPNWDSYGAKRIDERCIEKAFELWRQLSGDWQVVPCNDGGVQLEQHGDLDVEITISPRDAVETRRESMNFDLRIPEEIDPANELERQLAVFYCRLNTWQHPLTGTELSLEERDWLRKNVDIMNVKGLARDGVNQRLWIQGRPAWTNITSESESEQ